ncbi:MAG: hypothetical protein WDN04_25630 [Rhodospirillales bacterium]
MAAGTDRVIEDAEIQRRNKRRHQAHLMIRRYELVDIDHLPAHGQAIGSGHPRLARVQRRPGCGFYCRQIRK